jgi:hypothetical protein
MTFADKTSVSPEKSRAEIEGLLRKYGADQFISGWEDTAQGGGRAMIGFRCKDRFIRFELQIPPYTDERFVFAKHPRHTFRQRRTENQRDQAHEQEIRRMWRALALVIKAKLEAVESRITTFENEFMAHIVLPDGKTVGQHIVPAIADAYSTGKLPRLLPALGETS